MKYLILLLYLLSAQHFLAQEAPHTPTLPGIPEAPFLYVESIEVGIHAEKLERLRQEMKSWVAHGDPVGNELLIIKDGKIIFHETFGWANLDTKKPVQRNSIWNIRSMTKPITATAIMMLAEDGELSLDDKVINYIPEFKGRPETTIRHLLSHTTGYSRSDFSDYDDEHRTLEEWFMSGATKEPTGTFGQYEYTDFSFVSCAIIIEKITGKSLEEFITENIINPLGLEDTRVNFSDNPEWRSRISTWYIINQESGEYEVNWPADRDGWRIFGGAWGMFSTVLDYAEFLSCFQNKGSWNEHVLLKQESTELMTSPQGFINGIPMYGYGWMLQVSRADENSILSYGHRGGDALAGYVFPKDNMIVVYMSHSRGGLHRETLMEVLNELELIEFTKYRGSPIRPENFNGRIAKLNEEDLMRFSGQFEESGKYETLCEVSPNEGYLTMKLYPDSRRTCTTFDLVYLGENKFAVADYLRGELDWLNPEAIIHFKSTNEAITSFEFTYNGRLSLKAKRMGSID